MVNVMMWIDRIMDQRVRRAVASRPVVLLTGARQTGKSSLLRRAFPDIPYLTLDNTNLAMEAVENPRRFLSRSDSRVIIDEAQYAPDIFREIKILVDENRETAGRWILTGSQKFELMSGAAESLAGRMRVLHLETLGAAELRGQGGIGIQDYLWRGGYPELWANSSLDAGEFFDDYLASYLERDLTRIVHVSNLNDFRRFIQCCALRAGQLLNMADLARDVGISADTAKRWLSAMSACGLIYLLPPYFANLGKRLAKSPKLFFADHGLLCHLLNIGSLDAWWSHPARGAAWENLVFGELVKMGALKPGRDLFFYRDQNAVEIDFLVDHGTELALIEAKASERVEPKKLNFAKVAPLFNSKVDVARIVACTIPESSPIHGREHILVNPLLDDVPIKAVKMSRKDKIG